MRAPSSSLVLAGVLAAMSLSGLACSKAAGTDVPAPEAGERFAPPPGDDPLAELEQLESRMRALDLPVASLADSEDDRPPGSEPAGGDVDDEDLDESEGGARTKAEPEETPAEELGVEATYELEAADDTSSPAPGGGRRDRRSRCTNLCDLSVAICELEGRICSLSDGHGDDPTYADACRRAADDCDIADRACSDCADG